MDVSKFLGHAFVKVADVKANGTIRATITDVKLGQFGKLDITLDDGAKLSVNVTNAKILAGAYSSESDHWVGQVIELGVGEVEFAGKLTEMVTVKPISRAIPPEKRPRPKPKKHVDMDDQADF
jgi:hypothetical protein